MEKLLTIVHHVEQPCDELNKETSTNHTEGSSAMDFFGVGVGSAD